MTRWKEYLCEPLWWSCVIGAAVAALLLALMPLMWAEFNPREDVLPCPAAFKDPRCTSEMTHVGR